MERLEDRLAPAAWNAIGPAPVLVNGSASGAFSGRIASVAADPTDANTIYIGAAGGGVWKTTNGGTSWTPLTDTQSTLFMGALAIAPGTGINGRILYAGTGEANFSGDSFYGRGILVSKDSGATWTLTGNSLFNQMVISKVVIDPNDASGNTAYAAVADGGVNGFFGGRNGIWKTTDGGTTWNNTTANFVTTGGANPFTDLVMDPMNHLALYAAVGNVSGSAANGVYITINGGTTWTLLANSPQGTGTGRIALAIADVNTIPVLYAAVSVPSGNQFGQLLEMAKSTDGGATWSTLNNTPNYLGVNGFGQGWYDTALAIDPGDATANTVYAGGTSNGGGPSFIETTNGGTGWTNIQTGSNGSGPHTDHHAIAFDHNGKLLDGNDGGIWRLDNHTVGSIQWTDLNGNLDITEFTGIAIDPTTANIAYGGSQDNGTEKYTGGIAWNLIAGGDGGFVRVDPNNHLRIYQEFTGASLRRSDDGGASFTAVSAGIAGNPNSTSFYVPYVLDPLNSNRVVLGTDFVNVSTNNGTSWSQIGTPGVAGFNPNDDPISAIAAMGNTVYAATHGSGRGDVWVTTNNGGSWSKLDPITLSQVFYFPGYQDLEIDTGDATGQTAYIVMAEFSDFIVGGSNTSANRIFKTTNGGTNWTDIGGDITNIPVWSIAIDHAHGILYAGTDNGVYSSSDAGQHWSVFGTGMPNAQVVSLEYLPNLQVLGAGTHGRGMFEISTQTVTPVVITPPSDQNASENVGGSFSLGSFSDQGSGPWTATVNWGEPGATNQNLPNPTGAGALNPASHTYTEEGMYTVTVTVTDTGTGQSDSKTFHVTVAERAVTGTPGNVQTIVNQQFNGAVATFTDPAGAEVTGNYSASIDWGDNTTTTTGSISVSNNIFTITGSHTYSNTGNPTIKITVTHETTTTPIQTPASVGTTPPVVITPPTDQNASENVGGSFSLGSFSDQGSGPWTATVNWGEPGATNQNLPNPTGAGALNPASHTYTEEGMYTVTVTVTDTGTGQSDTKTFHVTVAERAVIGSPLGVVAAPNVQFNGAVATFTDPAGAEVTGNYSASIDWGDNTTTTTGSISVNNNTFTITGSHTYTSVNNFPIKVTITHEGTTTPVQGSATVGNLGPALASELAGIGFWANANRGQKLILSFNGGSTSTALATWLAQNFPNLYGANAGNNNLTGKTNADVAALFLSLVNAKVFPWPLDAEVLATALNVYASTLSLGGTAGQAYGFQVDNAGLGAHTWSVNTSGQAFFVPNGTKLTITQLLQLANAVALGGEPWAAFGPFSPILRLEALIVFLPLNEMGTVA